MTGYPLLSNPYKHYYVGRKGSILGIVLHVTAGLEDHTLPDGGAEVTVKYGQHNQRPASWHGIVDSDSIIDCLPDSYTAFHVIGYNSRTLGLEIANADAKWGGKPAGWVDATLRNAAAWCRPRVQKYGLPVSLASRSQVDNALRTGRPFGFTYHYLLDPKNRIDPGKDFPWTKFSQLLTGASSKPVTPRGPFPLPSGHFFGMADGTARAHDGTVVRDRVGISQIQTAVGADTDGMFGPQTKALVAKYQATHNLVTTGKVTAIDWPRM